MTDVVFVSYPRERADEAVRWKVALEQAGHRTFVCHVDGGAAFAALSPPDQRTELVRRIGAASAVLVLWDRNYSRAAWCGWELARAVERAGVPVFVHRLDATSVPPALRDRVEQVAAVADLGALLEQPRAAPAARPLAGVPINPAASLLESRLAARFDAWTRGPRELTTIFGWLAGSLIVQLVTYFVAARWMTGEVTGHLWALLAAVNIAMTIVGAFLLSVGAAAVAGIAALGLALAGLAAQLAWRGDPDQHDVTVAAAAMGTFHVSVVMLLRDYLIGGGLGWVASSRDPRSHGKAVGHGRALLGVAVVIGLLWYGLRSLDDITELVAQLKRDDLPILDKVPIAGFLAGIPVTLGKRVGLLVGGALAVATFRRVSFNHRATDPRRLPLAILWSLVAIAIGTLIGFETGQWIRRHFAEAISTWAGSYAGAQIGVLLAVGLAVPISASTGAVSLRQERAWGVAGAIAVLAMITYKIHSFQFAKDRTGIELEILRGAAYGFAPVLVVRLIATVRAKMKRSERQRAPRA